MATALTYQGRADKHTYGTRDTVFVMSTVSKGAINERGTSRTEEL